MKLVVKYFDTGLKYRTETWTFNDDDEPSYKFEGKPLIFVAARSNQYKEPSFRYGVTSGEPELPSRIIMRLVKDFPNSSPIATWQFSYCLADNTMHTGYLMGYPLQYDNAGAPARFRMYMSGGNVFEGGEGDLEVLQSGKHLRLMGNRNLYFNGEMRDNLVSRPDSKFWNKMLEEILEIFDQHARDTIAIDNSDALSFVSLAEERNTLIGAEYSLVRMKIKDLRDYFLKAYSHVPMFNFQLSGDVDRDYAKERVDFTRDLLAKVGCETNFVVLHGHTTAVDRNRIEATQLVLLDGFMRVLWAADEDEVIFVKYYSGLNESQLTRLMLTANFWKAIHKSPELLFDRGFRLWIYTMTDVFMDLDFVKKYLGPYLDYNPGGSHSSEIYQSLWENKHFLTDVVYLSDLSKHKDLKGQPLKEEMCFFLARSLGKFRRHKTGHDVVLDFPKIAALLDANQSYLDKINGMAVSGTISNNIRDKFGPELATTYKAVIDGSYDDIEFTPIIPAKKSRKKKES